MNRYNLPNCVKNLYPINIVSTEYSEGRTGIFEIEILAPDGKERIVQQEPELKFDTLYFITIGIIKFWIIGSIYHMITYFLKHFGRLFTS